MKRLTFLLVVLSTVLSTNLSTFAQAPYQDCHIVYKDIPNFHYYGRQVQQRTDAANLDTLTCVYDGSFAYDTLSRSFKGYDGDGFHSLAFGEVRDTVIDLSSAEILALNGTPKTVVAAPGSGKYLQVLNATVKYTYVTTAYSSGTRLRIGTTPSQDPYSCVVLNATTSTIRTFEPPTHSVAGYSGSLENTAIKVDADVAPTTGDGTAKVWVRYQIIEF